MFVFSFRANKPKLIAGLCLLMIITVSLSLLLSGKDTPVKKYQDISVKASNAQERIAFLSQYGWDINEEPIEVTEVIVPTEFNEAYTEYNNLQKSQGMDLLPYKGLRVKKWVYEIKNYPEHPSVDGSIRATLLIYNGMVIGGDVSDLELNGFMQGFSYPEAAQTSLSAQF